MTQSPENDVAEALYRAIDWDFVEVFHDPEDGDGYYSPRHFCEHIAARVVPPASGIWCRECGPGCLGHTPIPAGAWQHTCMRPGDEAEFRMGDFIEVELSGEWKRGLIVTGGVTAHTFGVAVVGHEGLLAYGNPEVIPGAEKFLRKVRVIPPEGTDR